MKPKTRTIVKTAIKKPKTTYLASKGGKVAHEKNCPFAKKIIKKNRIAFESKTKAFNDQYKACSCILKDLKKHRRKSIKKKVTKKKPKMRTIVRTIIKTVVKRPRKRYLASKSGKIVHEKNCPFAKMIVPASVVIFKSKTEALNKGYKACGCIKEMNIKKRRRKAVKVKKVPVKTRTIIKTIVKKPKKVYLASKSGKIVHEKNCPFAKNIRKESQVTFKSKGSALNAGYKACTCIRKIKKVRKN
ncbi:MAG: hypothetical protein KJ597_06375 [Nanoarchaeota archaeon]|nr:hypothetical protein [Nanoarchaeota archaeon]MBU1623173.1 hypothetical protein [Nanoarchaeota archaeon]